MKSDNISLIKQFKPTILFLVKFVGIYLIGNIAYGIFITAYEPGVDPVTHAVSVNVSGVLNWFGTSVSYHAHQNHPTTSLVKEGRAVLSVYEGCNSLNTMIIFMAFLFAFGPIRKTLLWFVPTGLGIIYLMNLVRIMLLFVVAERLPHFMYFTHKYLFTAFLFAVIFLLWIWWIRKYAKPKQNDA